MPTQEKLEATDQAPAPDEDAEVDTPTPLPPQEEWASADDLTVEPFRAVTLPNMGKRVRVRYLSNVEIAKLGMLPHLANFMELAMKYAKTPMGDLTSEQRREYALELATYSSEVAHRCVLRPDGDPERDEPCDSCDDRHPPSLWTRQQVGHLAGDDTDLIRRVAEQEEELEQAAGPLSEGPQPSASSLPADTGDETPPTSSG